MTGLSQSQFLQALGWSTLNSFWQMAFLWCCFWVANHLFTFSASKKYALSVAAIGTGFLWFVFTFSVYYKSSFTNSLRFFDSTLELPASSMPIFLTAASVTYLLLLMIPAYRLYLNWRFVQALRKTGLQKIDIQYKLFVKKVAAHLNIQKEIGVYLSNIIKSPVTIGFLKPIILLPVASVNHLSLAQAEAVLLHELSHIKRYDYLVNLFLRVVHTLLYFNPFVRFFVRTAEMERENCCDQMVLQFGYDKVSYATALLSLEKAAPNFHVFALGAAGKKNLLERIEKIVGMEKKPVFRFTHFAGFLTVLLGVFAINTLVITANNKGGSSFAFNNMVSPFYFFDGQHEIIEVENTVTAVAKAERKLESPIRPEAENAVQEPSLPPEPESLEEPGDNMLMHVAYDETENKLSRQEKENVKAVVENTKKVLASVQWKEVEKAIADVLTEHEKQLARHEYIEEVQKINWQQLEKNLKAEYEKINWPQINTELKIALAEAQLDSLEHSYELLIKQIEKAEAAYTKANSSGNISLLFPDSSIDDIKMNKNEILEHLAEIRSLRSRKVIKL